MKTVPIPQVVRKAASRWRANLSKFLLVSAAFALPAVASAADKPTWTILIYAHGDHNLSPSLVVDMLEMQKCGSSERFNIVVQSDFQKNEADTYEAGLPGRFGAGTTRWLISQTDSKRVESRVLERFEEIDSDVKKRLTNFIQWGMEEYPADRYGLILWDHGGSWMGFGGDSHDGRRKRVSPMKLNAIEEAIEAGMDNRIEQFEFLSFDACLMANQEVIAQVSHLAKLFIACGEIDYGPGWDYQRALGWLKEFPDCKIEDFGKAEVKTYNRHHKSVPDRLFMSHSAFDTSLAGRFTTDATRFATALRHRYNRHAARAQREAAAYFVLGLKSYATDLNPFFDLEQLAQSLQRNKEAASSLRAAASRLLRTARAMRVANVSGVQKRGAGGINVYLPFGKAYKPSLAVSRFEKVEADQTIKWSRVIHAARKARLESKNPPVISVQDGDRSVEFSVSVRSGTAYKLSADIVQFDGEQIIDLGEAGTINLDGARSAAIQWDRRLPTVIGENGKRIYLPVYSTPVDRVLTVDVQFDSPSGDQFDGTLTFLRQPGQELKIVEAVGAQNGGTPRGFQVEKGTKVTPYLTRIRKGEVKSVLSDQHFVVHGTLSAIPVSAEVLPAGEYFLAIQADDAFGWDGNIEFKRVVIR